MAGPGPYDYDVFLSHASANKAWVEVLARNLKNQGYRLFYDEWSLTPGEALVDGLYEGLESSSAGVLVVSPEAANSGWVSVEWNRMVNRRAQDPGFVIMPVVYGELAEFPFLEDILWVDFREPHDYRKAFYRLLCGLKKRQPGSEQRFEGPLEIPGAEAATPLDESAEDFFAGVFAALDSSPIVLLLAQADRASGPVIQTLLGYARERFAEPNTLHVTPPFDPQASTSDYFALLAQQCGLGEEVSDAVGFEAAMHARLAVGEPLFLLVHGLENGSNEGRRLLAGMLRNFNEKYPYTLRVAVCGGAKLADLRYAQGDLSMLSHAEIKEWPELTPGDAQALQSQSFPGPALSEEEAVFVLKVCGGHPRLLRYCLERRKEGGGLDEEQYRRALVMSPVVYQLFIPFRRDPEAVARLCDWLHRDDLGPAEPYISDDLLRTLYWKNLLRRETLGDEQRLRWRCSALTQAGKTILGCG